MNMEKDKLIMNCFIYLLLFLLTKAEKNANDKVAYEHCKINRNQKPFDVLPGTGWDNLENVAMGRILDLNFSDCSFSNDNRYLIPNHLSLFPQKIFQAEINSEIFRHFSNYTSMTSKSININAGKGFWGVKLGGSFSFENTQIKRDQLETKSIITRVQLRYNVYQSMFEPDAPLFPAFKNRIVDIAGLIVENKDSLYPAYLADMIIRDYGTHVIRSIDVGAVLSKTDALKSTYVKSLHSDSNIISASATASFTSLFSMSAKFSTQTSQSEINEYNKNVARNHIYNVGGTLFGVANASVKDWEMSIMDNLGSIDRRGEPLYDVITPRALPDLDGGTVYKINTLLREAIERYYIANERKGCLDFTSPNFNPDANVDAGNCEHPAVNFTFGGVYQVCDGPAGPSYLQANPLTGNFSCPKEFSPVKLHSGLIRCDTSCSGWWFWRHCNTQCSHFTTYWCYPNVADVINGGYQFGGVKEGNCPLDYFPLKIGLSVEICVTMNNDPNNPFAIKFGGIYSCSVGNPLARKYVKGKPKLSSSSKMMDLFYWPKTCAPGYISHIVTIEQGCQISYCTETNKVSMGSTPKLIKPPFISIDYNPNSTRVTIFSNKKGQTFTKDVTGSWEKNNLNEHNKNVLTGSIIGSVALVILIVFALFVYFRRRINTRNYRRFAEEDNVTENRSINNTERV